MAFHPEHLPKTVCEFYKKGPLMWMAAVQAAIQVGIRNPDTLTNIVFYVHHPELEGRPLRKHETKLIADYNVFRTMIKAVTPVRNQSTANAGSGGKTEHFYTVEFGEGQY